MDWNKVKVRLFGIYMINSPPLPLFYATQRHHWLTSKFFLQYVDTWGTSCPNSTDFTCHISSNQNHRKSACYFAMNYNWGYPPYMSHVMWHVLNEGLCIPQCFLSWKIPIYCKLIHEHFWVYMQSLIPYNSSWMENIPSVYSKGALNVGL